MTAKEATSPCRCGTRFRLKPLRLKAFAIAPLGRGRRRLFLLGGENLAVSPILRLRLPVHQKQQRDMNIPTSLCCLSSLILSRIVGKQNAARLSPDRQIPEYPVVLGIYTELYIFTRGRRQLRPDKSL